MLYKPLDLDIADDNVKLTLGFNLVDNFKINQKISVLEEMVTILKIKWKTKINKKEHNAILKEDE